MTGPGDVTGNYEQLMAERGWGWGELAAEFDRQAAEPSLDGGENARGMARWARDREAAARARAAEDDERRALPPQDPRPEPPRRTAVQPRPRRQG